MPRSSEIRDALAEIAPVLLAVLPFGIVYGTVAIDSGLTVLQTLGLSAAVYAGASQLVALQMIGLGSPVWAVTVSIFALNFRHVLYSASLGRKMERFSPWQKALALFFLVDPVFADGEARAARGPLTKRYYFTYALVLYFGWLAATLLGAIFGRLAGDTKALAFDFILPVYFLVLLMGFRRRPRFLPVMLASGATAIALYLTLGSPWHVTLGALGGIAYAALAKPAADEPSGGQRA